MRARNRGRADAGQGPRKGRRGAALPVKACARCGRPIVWRRKWARDWHAVRYCSARCRCGRG